MLDCRVVDVNPVVCVRSVEDMMKRSFSEFRTQRELGAKELPKIMKKSMDALNKIKATVSVGRPAQHYKMPSSRLVGEVLMPVLYSVKVNRFRV